MAACGRIAGNGICKISWDSNSNKSRRRGASAGVGGGTELGKDATALEAAEEVGVHVAVELVIGVK